jgi:peptidoglycan/LPS O-acetylase OafA/YrhL
MTGGRIEHQPALDGVRAWSVVAVLCFHGEVLGFSGGYLGVSVFFTLSGFLITSLLLAERAAHAGRPGWGVDVSAFYVRRAKRLLPASLLCVLSVAVVAAVSDWFDAVPELRRDLLGALGQVANWVFLSGDGSYQELFAQAAGQASPLEHYWSLAIEEQFYWVWPIVFVGLCRVARTHRSRTVVLGAVTALFGVAAPFIASVWGADAAYWATPARAAEILVGAFAAFLVRDRTLPDATRWLAPAALATLAVCVVSFPSNHGPAFQGALPLIGVVSAALVIGLQVPSATVRCLSWRPFTWLGRISYGVYLYHWPVFVLVDAPLVDLAEPWRFVTRMTITIALAQLSFVLLERPIRIRLTWRPAAVGTLAIGATVAMAIAAIVLVPAGGGEYWRTAALDDASIVPVESGTLAPLVPATSTTTAAASTTSTTDPVTGGSASTSAAPATPAAPATVAPLPVLSRPVRIVVAGDSTAEATGAGLVQWAVERPDLAQVTIAAEKGCGFVRGGEMLVQDWAPIDPRCDRWLERDLVERVSDLRPDVVMLMTTSWDVLDHRWSPDEQLSPLDPTFADHILLDFTVITDELLAAGAGHVVWVRQLVPNVFWWSSGQTQEDPARHEVLYGVMDDLARTHPGTVSVVDLASWADDADLTDDHDARPDGVHWAPDTAARVARDFLGEQLIRSALGL